MRRNHRREAGPRLSSAGWARRADRSTPASPTTCTTRSIGRPHAKRTGMAQENHRPPRWKSVMSPLSSTATTASLMPATTAWSRARSTASSSAAWRSSAVIPRSDLVIASNVVESAPSSSWERRSALALRSPPRIAPAAKVSRRTPAPIRSPASDASATGEQGRAERREEQRTEDLVARLCEEVAWHRHEQGGDGRAVGSDDGAGGDEAVGVDLGRPVAPLSTARLTPSTEPSSGRSAVDDRKTASLHASVML